MTAVTKSATKTPYVPPAPLSQPNKLDPKDIVVTPPATKTDTTPDAQTGILTQRNAMIAGGVIAAGGTAYSVLGGGGTPTTGTTPPSGASTNNSTAIPQGAVDTSSLGGGQNGGGGIADTRLFVPPTDMRTTQDTSGIQNSAIMPQTTQHIQASEVANGANILNGSAEQAGLGIFQPNRFDVMPNANTYGNYNNFNNISSGSIQGLGGTLGA